MKKCNNTYPPREQVCNTSISAYLQTSRHRVYEVLRRWAQEGHAGLDDKPSTPHRPARKAGIREINEVGKLVVNSANVRRFLARNIGNWRECWESLGRRKPWPLPMRILSSTCCKLVVTKVTSEQ